MPQSAVIRDHYIFENLATKVLIHPRGIECKTGGVGSFRRTYHFVIENPTVDKPAMRTFILIYNEDIGFIYFPFTAQQGEDDISNKLSEFCPPFVLQVIKIFSRDKQRIFHLQDGYKMIVYSSLDKIGKTARYHYDVKLYHGNKCIIDSTKPLQNKIIHNASPDRNLKLLDCIAYEDVKVKFFYNWKRAFQDNQEVERNSISPIFLLLLVIILFLFLSLIVL